MNKATCWLVLASMLAVGDIAASEPRWYKDELVAQGKPLFLQHCAGCHGPQGEGAPNWREPLPDGKLPPPPLNKNGHAWHHPLSMITRQIQTGGAPVGGSMPAFVDTLDSNQVQAIIAYFQSLWPEETYRLWLQHGGLAAPARPEGTR